MKQECHFFVRAGLCLAGVILLASARGADAKPKYFGYGSVTRGGDGVDV